MQITLTIPNDQANRVINAICTRYNYQDKIPDSSVVDTIVYIDNPETKGQFARRQIIEHIKRVVKEVELEEAKRALVIQDPDVS